MIPYQIFATDALEFFNYMRTHVIIQCRFVFETCTTLLTLAWFISVDSSMSCPILIYENFLSQNPQALI